MALSNGNSFSNGQSMGIYGNLEPWFIRVLMAPIQDRGPV